MRRPSVRQVLAATAATVVISFLAGCDNINLQMPQEPAYAATENEPSSGAYSLTEADQKAFVKYFLDGVDSLNVRQSAGTDAEIVSKIQKGSLITYDSESNGWMHITSVDGKATNGYVSSRYLDKVGEEKVATIWEEGANVHIDGVSYSEIIGKPLSLGDVITWDRSSNDKAGGYTRITSINGKPTNGHVKTTNINFNPYSKDQKYTQYEIQRGDTLIGIAKKFNMDIRQLKEINKLTTNDIYEGQKINVVPEKVITQSIPIH